MKVVLIFAVCVLGIEGVLRFGLGLGDPPIAVLTTDTEYELPGPRSYRRWGNRIEINAEGLRSEPLQEGSERALLIGDSVVYGGHFLDQDEVISNQMEALLAARDCARQVLPMAVSSWGPENQRAFLEKRGALGADWAGIVVSAHDLYDVPQKVPQILPYRTRTVWSATADAVLGVLERMRQAEPPTLTVDERRRISLNALTEMKTRLTEAGAQVVMIYHPTVGELDAEPRWEEREFREWAARHRVPFFDLRTGGSPVEGYRDQIHPNAQGAARIAEALVQEFGCLD